MKVFMVFARSVIPDWLGRESHHCWLGVPLRGPQPTLHRSADTAIAHNESHIGKAAFANQKP